MPNNILVYYCGWQFILIIHGVKTVQTEHLRYFKLRLFEFLSSTVLTFIDYKQANQQYLLQIDLSLK